MKSIRLVCIDGRDYYCYDLDADTLGRPRRLYAKTKEELIQKIEKAKTENTKRTVDYKPASKKLSDYIRYYLKHLKRPRGENNTDTINRLLFLLQRTIQGGSIDKDIDAITTQDIEKFCYRLSERYYVTNINEIIGMLDKVFALAIEDGIDVKADISKMEAPNKSNDKNNIDYIPTPEEFEMLLSYCINDNRSVFRKNEDVVIASMLTGLMPSELYELRHKDIDTKRGILKLKDQEYPLSESASKWFAERIEEDEKSATGNKGQQDDYFFATSNGTPPSRQALQRTLVFIIKRCGLPKGISYKKLQQAYVISELNKGTTKEAILQSMNFKSVKVIQRIKKAYKISQEFFAED